MWKRKRRARGEFVYLSVEKLRWLAADLHIETALSATAEVEAGAAAELGVPPFGKLLVDRRVQRTEVNWGEEARVLTDTVEKVLQHLEGIPNLEQGELIREGEWFSFHRDLKFGVGHSDAGPPVKALIAVDRVAIPQGSLTPGLLMNGSIAHVLPPYATEELRKADGSRSGSGTERLFNWLEEVRALGETDPGANWGTILSRSEGPPPKTQIALDMYDLFAREEWLAPYLAEPLMHGSPCEGVAKASFVTVGDEGAVVMGSPLFIRRSPLPD